MQAFPISFNVKSSVLAKAAAGLLGISIASFGLVSCGGNNTDSPSLIGAAPQGVVTVTVSPSTSTVDQNTPITFTASVTGTSNHSVNWSVSVVEAGLKTVKRAAVGATITSGGVFTATAQGQYTVTATSASDSAATGIATVTVNAIVVKISPTSLTIGEDDTSQLTATVTGTPNKAVTWKEVPGSEQGQVDQSGTYSSPDGQGTDSVVVTSQADPSKSATALITIGGEEFVRPKPKLNLTK